MSPIDPDDCVRAGWEFHRRGDFRQAEVHYRQALAIDPNHPPALNSLGTLAMQFNQLELACKLLQRALAGEPGNLTYILNFGSALLAFRRDEEALAQAQCAVALRPDLPGPHTLLAAALMNLQRPDEALTACERALAIDPEFPQALQAVGAVYGMLNRPGDVIANADRLIPLQPQDPRVHWNKGIASLLLGEFATGWREFEWRTRLDHLRRQFPQPQWDHQDLRGKTILLHCEGGFGDAIHFVRYLPLVQQRAGKVLLECPEPLVRLFRMMPQAPPIFLRDGGGEALPAFDYHCPLQSLPFNFDMRLETIPADVPYLRADPQKTAEFATHLGGDSLRVGLVWAGSVLTQDLRTRTLAAFAPVFDVPNVRFFGLQVGTEAAQCTPPVKDLSPHLRDFADLAAAIMNLDLLISVDTGVAHLAGALAREVWTLIPYVPDFRWMLDRTDTPWYPTMRLYRQTARTDWTVPIARLAADLQEKARL